MSRRCIDLSHPIEDGMITYEGLPAPMIEEHLGREASRGHYAAGTEFHIGRISLVGNTGTYLDAPFHRFPDAPDVAGLALDALAGLDGIVVRITRGASRAIDAGAFSGIEVAGRAVLVHTGWDRHWRTPHYFSGHPFLTAAAAEHLVARGARLVGIDSLNIDDNPSGGPRPVHTLLLGAGIPIVEHLCNLGELPDAGFEFSAVPAPVRGLGSFPVRAYARI